MKRYFLSFLLFTLLALSTVAQNKEARLVDEFGELSCDDLIARLQNLATQTGSENGSVALIFMYEGKHPKAYDKTERYFWPRFGESAARTQTMKTRLDFLKYGPKNFIFADGGFREKYWVEAWIVPKGAKLPKATPSLESMKYRKGAPTDICREF